MFFSMVLVKKKLEIRSNSDRINNISTWITTSAWPLDRLQKRNASQGRYIHKDGFTIWQRMVGKPGWSSTSRCDTGDDHHSPPTSLTAILRLTSHPIVGGTSQREGEVMVRRGEGEVMVRRGGGETTCDSFRLYHEWDVTWNAKWLSGMLAENDHRDAPRVDQQELLIMMIHRCVWLSRRKEESGEAEVG